MINKNFCLNNIHIKIEIHEDLEELLDFFIPEIFTESTCSKLSVNSTINIKNSPLQLGKGLIVSKSIRKNENGSSYFFNDGLLVRFKKVLENKIEIETEIFVYSDLYNNIKRFLKGYSSNINNQFVQAIRHAFVYPYMLILQINYNSIISHGSSFLIDDKCYAIIGFDGIGKSTISSLVYKNGGEIFSDNFILYDGTFIYGVPEPLRIICKENNHYYGKKFKKIGLSYTKNKLSSFIYTYLGNEYKFALSKLDFHIINHQLTSYLPEFYDYNRFCAVASVSNPNISNRIPRVISVDHFYEAQRSTIVDNERLLNDILSI